MSAPVKELRPLVQEYQRAADKKQFRRKHEGTLILYEAAAKALKDQGLQKLPDLYALKAEYKQLAEQKDQLQRQYTELNARCRSMTSSSRMWTVFCSRITGRKGTRPCEYCLTMTHYF